MTLDQIFAAMEATWPAAAIQSAGPWLIRDGQNGGKRVSAATAEAGWQAADIPLAEAAMLTLGQPPLFLIRAGEEALDGVLNAQGYRMLDPVVVYAVATADLARNPPEPMSCFAHWPPLAIATQLWSEAGIGPGRLAVMHRAQGAKVAILSRRNDRPTGIAFVAMSKYCAVLHALEVAQSRRRQGSAHNLLRAAACWAQDQGADTLALMVTKANDPARRLYASVGMATVGHYHYRQK